MSVPQVNNVRRLTIKDAKDIWTLIEKDQDNANDKYNAFDMISSVDNQEHFTEQDFVIGDVTIDGTWYNFIHGFPGDEPCGVLYTADLKIVEGLHWSMDRGFDKLNDWYLLSVNKYDEDDDFETIIPPTWFASE